MARNSITITVEGVLQKVVSYAPIQSGLTMYHGLATVYQIILLSDYPESDVVRWLKLEGLNKHGVCLYSDSLREYPDAASRRVAQINDLRSRGFSVDFCIEPDPVVAAALLFSGVSVMNFLHSSYALPQWRPDYEFTPKPWARIEEEMADTRLLRSRDIKLKQIEEEYDSDPGR